MNDERPDEQDQRLGALLRDAVADVEPSDRLAEIRARTSASSPRRRGWYAAGAAVLVAASLTVAFVALGTDDERARDPVTSPTPSATGTAPAEPTAPPSAEQTVPVTVYFVGETATGPALFGERHQVPVQEQLTAPLALLTAGATDPDYRTLWPAGSLEEQVGFDGIGADGSYSVTLADPGLTERPAAMTEREAELAVQQVVRTLQATGTRAPVAFHVGTEEVPVLGVEATGGHREAPDLDTLAHVNVLSPSEGATVSGSFTASGVASSFEATVPWELRDPSGAVVREGFATAEGWMDRLYPWETEVDLAGVAPGEYTFAAMTDDPSGGAEGAGPTTDTRTLVIE